MLTFDFTQVEEAKSSFTQKLTPGLHAVKITAIEEVTPEDTTKSPYVSVTMENKDGQHEQRFFMSEGARPHSLSKLKHLFIAALGSETEVSKLTSLEVIQRVVVGKSLWVKLSGEEKVKSDGSGTYVRTQITWAPFAEKYVQGQQPTTLKFSEKYDISRLAVVPGTMSESTLSTETSAPKSEDLPF